MRRPWQLIVVRAWHADVHRIIRMTMSSDTGLGCTVYVTSSRSAGEQLSRWLDGVGIGDESNCTRGAESECPEGVASDRAEDEA